MMKGPLKSLRERLRRVEPRVRSGFACRSHRDVFDGVRSYCMFLGYPKSGHSLVGSLLDAHPDAIIAHELHALEYVGDGIGKHPLFHLLLENSQNFTSAGREWTGYSYTVPNQWHGRFRELRVIGDKRGAGSVYALEAYPELLDRLRATVGVPVRFIGSYSPIWCMGD